LPPAAPLRLFWRPRQARCWGARACWQAVFILHESNRRTPDRAQLQRYSPQPQTCRCRRQHLAPPRPTPPSPAQPPQCAARLQRYTATQNHRPARPAPTGPSLSALQLAAPGSLPLLPPPALRPAKPSPAQPRCPGVRCTLRRCSVRPHRLAPSTAAPAGLQRYRFTAQHLPRRGSHKRGPPVTHTRRPKHQAAGTAAAEDGSSRMKAQRCTVPVSVGKQRKGGCVVAVGDAEASSIKGGCHASTLVSQATLRSNTKTAAQQLRLAVRALSTPYIQLPMSVVAVGDAEASSSP
jgi:hypothetical protein